MKSAHGSTTVLSALRNGAVSLHRTSAPRFSAPPCARILVRAEFPHQSAASRADPSSGARSAETKADWRTDVWDALSGHPDLEEPALLTRVRFDIPIDVAALDARRCSGEFGLVDRATLQSEVEFQLQLLMR